VRSLFAVRHAKYIAWIAPRYRSMVERPGGHLAVGQCTGAQDRMQVRPLTTSTTFGHHGTAHRPCEEGVMLLMQKV
jgi:hypothetical protein